MSLTSDEPSMKATAGDIYTPLDATKNEIRILFLEPGGFDDDLQAATSMIQVPVPQLPQTHHGNIAAVVPYEAVSYCWGTATERAPLTLNGKPFLAPFSAAEALRHMRHTSEPRTLWIDALCINQADLTERAQQVSLMGQIYSSATRTVVWLGPSLDNEKTRRAMSLCHKIAEQFSTVMDPEDPFGNALEDREPGDLALDKVQGDLSLLDTIFGWPWFDRLWIWQEIALAPVFTFYIGDFELHGPDVVASAIAWKRGLTLSLLSQRPTISTLRRLTTYTILKLPLAGHPYFGDRLSTMLSSTRRCETIDPRDRIFALLGLTRWSIEGQELPLGIPPDYRKSARNVLRDATRVMFCEDTNLGLLGRNPLSPFPPGDRSRTLPWLSWVPAWNGRRELDIALCEDKYSASNGHRLMLAEQGTDPDILCLAGFDVSLVARISSLPRERFKGLPEFLEFGHSINEWRVAQAPSQPPLSIELLVVTLVRELIGFPAAKSRIDVEDDRLKEFVDMLKFDSKQPVLSGEQSALVSDIFKRIWFASKGQQ